MKSKQIILIFALLIYVSGIYAQIGIKAGVNMANEIKSFSQAEIASGFSSSNLTGYQIGLVYQAMPKKSGLGVEIAAMLSQKGSTFSDSVDSIKQGYTELNYVEVPLNLRYRITIGFIGIYGIAGIYGGYALSKKNVNEITNSTQSASFQSFMDHIDYGYNIGAGLEFFNKIQLGTTWSKGLKNTSISNLALPTPTSSTNSVLSVNLVYLF